jgi:hypothetical protein
MPRPMRPCVPAVSCLFLLLGGCLRGAAAACTSCALLQELSACAADVNQVCCKNGGCESGAPTTCDAQCEAVLVPMWHTCKGFLDANYGLMPVSAALGRSVIACKTQNPPTIGEPEPAPSVGPVPEPVPTLPPAGPEPEPEPALPMGPEPEPEPAPTLPPVGPPTPEPEPEPVFGCVDTPNFTGLGATCSQLVAASYCIRVDPIIFQGVSKTAAQWCPASCGHCNTPAGPEPEPEPEPAPTLPPAGPEPEPEPALPMGPEPEPSLPMGPEPEPPYSLACDGMPCLNGGTCVPSAAAPAPPGDLYTCTCQTGPFGAPEFFGKNCQASEDDCHTMESSGINPCTDPGMPGYDSATPICVECNRADLSCPTGYTCTPDTLEPEPEPGPQPIEPASQPCAVGTEYKARQAAMVGACCPPGAVCPPTTCDQECRDSALAFYRDCAAAIVTLDTASQDQLNSFRQVCEGH